MPETGEQQAGSGVPLDFLGELRRTHTCGRLRAAEAGSRAVLMGWVYRRRDLGGVIFVHLRDREGVTQIVFREDLVAAASGVGFLAGEDAHSVRVGLSGRRCGPGLDAVADVADEGAQVCGEGFGLFCALAGAPGLAQDLVGCAAGRRVTSPPCRR